MTLRNLAGKPPTKRQAQVLAYLSGYQELTGRPPTMREICVALALGSTNAAHCHLAALQRRGLIHRDRRVSRGIVIRDPVASAASLLRARFAAASAATADLAALLPTTDPAITAALERLAAALTP